MSNISDALATGPGLCAYAYQADLYCLDCGRLLIETIFPTLPASDFSDGIPTDSEILPQPVFFPESDTAEHCDTCGAFLYGGTEEKSIPDFTYSFDGSLVLLRPATEAAWDWITDNVSEERTLFAGALVIEPRFFDALADGIAANGFTIEEES